MAEAIKKLTRRLVHYLHTCSPAVIIKTADYLRSLTKESDENYKLTEVPDKLRKEFKQE